MNLDLLQAAAAKNTWGAILPELLLGSLALLLLILEILLPKRRHGAIPAVAILGQIAILIGTLVNLYTGYLGTETFGGLIKNTMHG